jgi:hypothetical protein
MSARWSRQRCAVAHAVEPVLWPRYGRTPAGVSRSRRQIGGYEQALVDARVQTRLGDGSLDVDVQGVLVSPFTGAGIEKLAIRATWLRNATPGSAARIVGYDKQSHGGTARTRLDVGGVALAYGADAVPAG